MVGGFGARGKPKEKRSRASLYYEPAGTSDEDLRLMRRLDELHLQWPFLGSRMLRDKLRLEGISVGQ